jgi:hypothetical protein
MKRRIRNARPRDRPRRRLLPGAVIGFLGALYIGTVIVIGIEALKALIGFL